MIYFHPLSRRVGVPEIPQQDTTPTKRNYEQVANTEMHVKATHPFHEDISQPQVNRSQLA